jgi:putative membrane protein
MYSYAGRFCDGLYAFGRYNIGGYFMIFTGLIIVIVIIYLLMKKSGDSITGTNHNDSPLEILQKRFVNGEINQEEFLEKKEILKGK